MAEIEKKTRGRRAGSSKVVKIEDPLMEPFYLNIEEKCFVIFKKGDSIMKGNYPNLGCALERIVKFQLASPSKHTTYSLDEYIKKYQNTLDKMTKSIKF